MEEMIRNAGGFTQKQKGEKAADHVGSGVGLNRPLPKGMMGGVRGDGNVRGPSIS